MPKRVVVSTGLSIVAGIAIAVSVAELPRPFGRAVELVRRFLERRGTRDFPRPPDFDFADGKPYFRLQAGEPNFKRREPFRDFRAMPLPPEHGPNLL